MALPYKRSFNSGRASEQLYNEELHKMYESVKHLTDTPPRGEEPQAKLHRSMWHDEENNALKWWDKENGRWRNYYENKFKITDSITSTLPPSDPVRGELWIHNEVLCYYDGTNWKPVKALIQDGSQFSLDIFRNFLLTSPLWEIGNTVLDDEDIQAFKDERRKYLQGVLDAKTDSHVTGDGSIYEINKHDCIENDPAMPASLANAKAQLIVPSLDYDRIFLDHDLDTDKYEEVNKVCIQYPKSELVDSIPSLVHINPGRMTKMTKRLIKIDRENPRINIPAENTEYYGFHANSPYGDFLLPDADDEHLCDYTIVDGGILLSYNVSQHYDFILAISYEFSWMKSTGTMAKSNNHSSETSFYIDDYRGPTNVFVDGYDLEDPYYTEDPKNKTITIHDDASKREVLAFHSQGREYGYIRRIDVNNNAVIRPLRDYRQPLLFVNGQAMHPVQDNITWNQDGTVTIPGAKMDMMWSIVELDGEELVSGGKYEHYTAQIAAGTVNQAGVIPYSTSVVPDTAYKDAILFIDGLLVKKEDLIFDRQSHTLTVNGGLRPGQSYILVEDKYQWLYDENNLVPALPVGNLTDSLVYINGKLICNAVAVETLYPDKTTRVNDDGVQETVTYPGVFNEVKCFKTVTLASDGITEVENRTYKKYNYKKDVWELLSAEDTKAVQTIAYSYENMPRSVRIFLPYTSNDKVQIYAFDMANDYEHPLIVGNILADYDHPLLTVGNGKYWDAKQQKEVPFSDPKRNQLKAVYIPGKCTLRVWCNGIRQYPNTENKCDGIQEYIAGDKDVDGGGTSFRLPEPFVGKITYAIELPENQQERSCTMEVLNHENVLPAHINMYKTKLSLFPGRVTVYVNGIRLPEDEFSIMDNYTLLIDSDTPLLGSSKNYPTETFVANKKKYTLNRPQDDLILVEVRQDERVETTVTCKGHPVYEVNAIDYGIDPTILEAGDEIMIFVNGLYFGPRVNDGYKKNRLRGSIAITQDDMLDIMNHDEEAIFLSGNTDYRDRNYRDIFNDKHYGQDNAKLTLEWR